MTTTLVTGSSDGIGARVADRLAGAGHRVIRHARSEQRAGQLRAGLPAGAEVVVGDLTSLDAVRAMAGVLAGDLPDVVVHNAGWAAPDGDRPVTADGFEATFQIHVLAPYLLTALLGVPGRLVYVSSDSIRQARLDPDDLQHERDWTSAVAYRDTKLAGTALTFALARRYPDALVNAVHPGWVRTKMSGDEAPLSLDEGADTPVWLADSDEAAARVTGRLFQDRREVRMNDALDDTGLQDRVLARCAELTGTPLG